MKNITHHLIFSIWVLAYGAFAQNAINVAYNHNSPQPETHMETYAVICITNMLDGDMAYQYRWGNGQWQVAKVARYDQMRHWWTYTNGSEVSPDFEIAFPANYDKTIIRHYNLKRRKAFGTDCDYGFQYYFAWVVTDVQWDLKTNNGTITPVNR